jgi:hypothetical protein
VCADLRQEGHQTRLDAQRRVGGAGAGILEDERIVGAEPDRDQPAVGMRPEKCGCEGELGARVGDVQRRRAAKRPAPLSTPVAEMKLVVASPGQDPLTVLSFRSAPAYPGYPTKLLAFPYSNPAFVMKSNTTLSPRARQPGPAPTAAAGALPADSPNAEAAISPSVIKPTRLFLAMRPNM